MPLGVWHPADAQRLILQAPPTTHSVLFSQKGMDILVIEMEQFRLWRWMKLDFIHDAAYSYVTLGKFHNFSKL